MTLCKSVNLSENQLGMYKKDLGNVGGLEIALTSKVM